ncbi:MAG TPA: Holliday junction resolvase-like protein, partial [Gemmatimonadales bacterium]|nr:Holliday junction resolvase-like protein [Gemmatimonadales bacterium]
MSSLPTALLVALVAALAVLAVALVFVIWKARYTRAVRLDAIQRSQAVTAGKVFEQLVPYLPNFPFDPR